MQQNKQNTLPATSFWDLVLFTTALLGIGAHFILMLFSLPNVAGFAFYDLPLLFVGVVCGLPLILQITIKVLKGDFGTDTLAVISFVTAFILGEYLAAVLVTIMMAGGQALETYAMKRASSALLALVERMPSTVHKRVNNKLIDIPISNIEIGDEVVVFPHETAPVDGTVIEGHTSMDESYLTGEPYRLSKAPGSNIISGSINGDSVIVVKAEKLAIDSRYAQIMKVMKEAEQSKPTVRRIGDRIGSVFAPISLIFAIAAWVISGDSLRFLSVLVIATPCPLLIAIPVTIVSAISMAARRGIIIKDPSILERLPTCKTAIFDKTGTLTYGKPVLVDVIVADGFSREDVLTKTASIERYSKHPLAESIIEAANIINLVLLDAAEVSEKPGQGLTGIVNGSEVKVTHRKKLSELNPKILDLLPPTSEGLECIILINDNYAATLKFRDMPRSDGKSFIDHLSPSHNINKVMLVSGDRESEVKYLANLLGIKNTLSSQTPEQKVEIVKSETLKAPTLFMGDGINDAPAIASATVGIAFGQHSSVTAEASSVVIMENSLTKVDELIHISTSTRNIIIQSAIGGMIFSLLGMVFASLGFITPVAGALIQEIIDIAAITNALRLTLVKNVSIDFKSK